MKPMASVTVNFVQKLFSLSKKSCPENEKVSSQSNETEKTLMEVQKILIWDDPFFSSCCIIFVNVIFWLIIYLDLKFYGIFFITLTILTCEQLWIEHFSKYLNQSVSDSSRASDDRISRSIDINSFLKKGLIMLKEIYVNVKIFRLSQPGTFCIVTCLGFLLLTVLGKWFSGVFTFYILLMLIMTVPGVLIRFLPPDFIVSVTELINSSFKVPITSTQFFPFALRQQASKKKFLLVSCSNNDDEVEPYLPDTNEEALEVLKLAGDLPLPNRGNDDEEPNDLLLERISERTSDTTESVSSNFSFYPESVTMPSPENSMDFWEFDLPSEEKAEVNLAENNGINFQSKHFDGDSSEEEFISGSTLRENFIKESKKNKIQQSNSILGAENLILLGKKLVSIKMKQKSTASDKESSSDTDSFELISEEDV